MILDDVNQQLRAIYARDPGRIGRVLEAGGGSHSHFVLAEGAQLVALDISFGQLIRHRTATFRIQADLEHSPLAPGSMDMVVCFNVIEHLADPASALDAMGTSLGPGGLLLLGFPIRSSLKALVTRMTPIGIHRAWYRYVVGKRDRGDGHFDAFPTVFHKASSLPEVLAWLGHRGFAIEFFRAYDGVAEFGVAGQGMKGKFTRGVYRIAGLLGQVVTLGKWNPIASDAILIASSTR